MAARGCADLSGGTITGFFSISKLFDIDLRFMAAASALAAVTAGVLAVG
jgi:hypothetical protein